jgi:hypothetical protein
LGWQEIAFLQYRGGLAWFPNDELEPVRRLQYMPPLAGHRGSFPAAGIIIPEGNDKFDNFGVRVSSCNPIAVMI